MIKDLSFMLWGKRARRPFAPFSLSCSPLCSSGVSSQRRQEKIILINQSKRNPPLIKRFIEHFYPRSSG